MADFTAVAKRSDVVACTVAFNYGNVYDLLGEIRAPGLPELTAFHLQYQFIAGKTIKKVIIVPKKMVNLIAG